MAQVVVEVKTSGFQTTADHVYSHDVVMACIAGRDDDGGWSRHGWKALWEQQSEYNMGPSRPRPNPTRVTR